MPAKTISIGNRMVGPGQPVFVIAELGYNFHTLDEALAAVDAAAKAGADAIKLQTFQAETIVAQGFDFPPEAGGSNQFQEFKRYEIDESAHRAIFERARKCGIVPFSTPSHYKDVELLERVGCDVYKIGSDDLTNLPFARHIAKLGKPVIFSSGMGTLDEARASLEAMRSMGNNDIVLLQCTSNYPIKDPAVLNLRVIETYRRELGVMVGFSDHTMGVNTAIAATALGATVIEKHFTLDKNNGAPDSFFSADPGELRDLVRAVRDTEKALGDGIKRPTPTESQMRVYTRKGLISRRTLKRGHTLTTDDVIIKRPAVGIAPADAEMALGRILAQDLSEDQPITWDCLAS